MSLTRRHFLATALLEALEAEGWKNGTGQYLRLQEVLRRLPSDADDDTLRLALAPLLARNAREQEQVYEIFERCRLKADELAAISPDMLEEKHDLGDEPDGFDRFIWPILALICLLFALLFFWIWYRQRPVIERIYGREVLVYAGQSGTFCPGNFRLDSILAPVKKLTLEYARPGVGEATVSGDTCLQYAPIDTSGSDSLRLSINFSNGQNAILELRIAISTFHGNSTNTKKGPAPKAAPLTQRKLPYPHNIARLTAEPPPAWVQWLGDWLPWLRWIALAVLLLALYAVWLFWQWKRRKLIAELRNRDKPPYIWNIHINDSEEVFTGDDFTRLLQVFRRRAFADAWRLDLPRSIAATAERGGMPEFRYRQHTRPVDYLLLIDRQSGQNHRARLFNALYEALRAREVEIARFYYDSDLRICHNEEYPNGIRLTEIAQRWGEARLLVAGTGMQLISPVSGKVEEWANTLLLWRESALFTPKAPEEWGRNERLLTEYFSAVLPATLESLAFWADEVEAGEDARLGDWPERLQRIPAAFIQPDDEYPLPMLQLQFSPETLRWIAACAIFPSLHWDLSLWLYRRLMPDAAEGKTSALSEDALKALTRLRWFVEGKMPGAVRIALLDWLKAHDSALLARLRADMADVLEQQEPPKDSAAWMDHRIQVALTRWQAATDAKKRKELEKEIARLLEAGADADVIALKPLLKARSPLDFIVPQSWKKYVHPGGLPGFGNRLWPLFGFLLTGLLAGLGLNQALENRIAKETRRCHGNAVEYMVSRSAFQGLSGQDSALLARSGSLSLCLQDRTDSLLWLERLMLDAIDQKRYALDDTLFLRFLKTNSDGRNYNNINDLLDRNKKNGAKLEPEDQSPRTDSIFSQISRNLAVAYWNQAVKHTKAGEPFAEAPGDSACWLCDRGWQRYNSDDAINIEHAKCQSPGDACPPEVFNRLMREGDAFFKISAFDLAINKYRSALACRPNAPEALDRIRKALQAQTTATKNEAVVRGLIIDSKTAVPISGVIIQTGMKPKESTAIDMLKPINAISNEQGKYRFSVQAGQSPVNLRFYKGGYETKEIEVTPVAGEVAEVDVVLEKDTRVAGVDTGKVITTPPPALILPEMVFIPGGTFTMGSPDSDPEAYPEEKPAHQVTVSDFSIGKYEVTNEEYAAFLNEKGNREEGGATWINLDDSSNRIVPDGKTYTVKKGYERFPVIYVSWYGAKAYCDWLSEKTGKRYRLPSEAEWEFAARGGKDSEKENYKYAGSNNLKEVGWYAENSDGHTHEAGKLKKNQAGIFDISGNVWEWCLDWYSGYAAQKQVNPQGPEAGTNRVLRGGSCFNDPQYCRVAYRDFDGPGYRSDDFGFRLALQ